MSEVTVKTRSAATGTVAAVGAWVAIAAAFGSWLCAVPARAVEVVAGAPKQLAVTVYRAPARASGAMDLDDLQGFALVTETRLIQLPAGKSRLRFEGVANGIEPESAIVTGLASGLIEKNQDARLLSPTSLQLAAVGQPLELVRTNRKTGITTRLPVTLEAANEDGVVFKSAAGVEAWKCTGLSETFDYSSADGLSAAPTLSILVDTERPIRANVTLSYLARGFDWFAQYTAQMSADGAHLNLGAWVTLANGNAVGFPAANTKVVAGRVNRDTDEVEPIDIGPPVLARCWPQETTSDLPAPQRVQSAGRESDAMLMRAMPMMALAAPEAVDEIVVTGAKRVTQEQLGDLKLYSVPDRTAVAARQSKQVRLMDRTAIPVVVVYGVDLSDPGLDAADAAVPVKRLIRTKNTTANHLGLALPSGRVAVFERAGSRSLLVSEAPIRDLAVDEEIEIDAGDSADVRAALVDESRDVASGVNRTRVPRRRAMRARNGSSAATARIDVSNARNFAVHVEIKLPPADVGSVSHADHPLSYKDGHPLIKLIVPGGHTESVRFTFQSP